MRLQAVLAGVQGGAVLVEIVGGHGDVRGQVVLADDLGGKGDVLGGVFGLVLHVNAPGVDAAADKLVAEVICYERGIRNRP